MDESPHCALSGEGALEFARSINFDEIVDPEELRGEYPNQQITNVTNQNFDCFAGFIFAGQPVQNVNQQQAHDNAGAETAGVDEERQDDQAHGTVGAEVVGELGERMDEQAHDTVGAVAIDRKGFLACANSTGIDTLASHFVNAISDSDAITHEEHRKDF